MANEKVVFKRGTTANLPTTKTPGTVLFDVSTGAMYVDDTSSSRVQVKDTTKLGKSENAVSASKLATARNINGMSFNGEANRVNYGTCSTAAATAAKTVACTGFALVTGAEITVKFTVTNTASSPTLNVNSTGAKSIYYNGEAISAGHLAANRTYTFRYNGTRWDLVGAVVYTHPTTAGNKHIPSGGSSGQILRWSASGTAVWGDDNNTDINVMQHTTNAANYRPLVFGYTNSSDPDELIKEDGSSVTGQVYVTNKIYSKPSTGELFASGLSLLTNSANGNLKQASTDNNVTHTFPSVSGTVLNTGNYLNYKGHLRQNVMNQPSTTPTSTPWFKVASTTITAATTHVFLTLAVSSGMIGNQTGILHVKVATGNTVGTNMSASAKWLNPTGIELGDFVLTYTETANTSVKYELWCKLTSQWRTYIFSVINEGTRTQAKIVWDLSEDTTAGSATYGTPTGVVESSYISNDSPAKMTENTADSEQYVFFNDSTVDGTLGYDSRFVYNPSKNTILITNPGGTRTTKYSGQGVAINTDSNTIWANGINYYTADGSTQLAALGAYGTASMTSEEFDTDGYLYMGKTWNEPWLKVAKSLSSMYSDFVISKTTPVLTINSGGSTETSIVLKRNGSSWRIMDASNGIFKIQNNWEDGAAVDWFDTFTMSTGGAATFKSSITATRFIGPASKIETVSSATKSYLLGTTTAPTSTVTGVTTTANTKVYATDGTLYATKFSGSGASLTSLNASNLSSGTVPIARIPTGTTSTTVALGEHGRHVEFSTTAPNANGTAAVGTATTVSRSDHVHPLQTSVSGNAGTATKLKTAVKIDGFSFDGSASINHYATCSTAAATVAKVATINTGTFTLTTGATIYVKFTNANTATSATLNVNSTGAKPIFHNGAAISASSYIKAGGVYQFVYDGTNWVINAGVEYTHPTSAGNKHIPSGGSSGQFLKWSTAGTAAWSSVTKSDVGLGNVENKSSATIRGELTKDNVTTALGYTPPTQDAMTGATSSAAGTKGLVPAPAKGKQTAFLRGDGTWVVPTDTDTKVNMVSSATKSYLLGTTTAPTTDTVGVTSTAHSDVYATNGTLYATKFSGSGASLTSLNASNISSGTLSADRLATSGATAGTYGESAAKTATHGGTISIPKITIDNKGRVTSASSITVTLPSDNNTDTKVTSTTTNPTSAKSYYPTFVTGATTGGVSINNGLQYQSLEGTTSADGYGILKLGNPTASGTAANKYGRLDIFSIGTSYGSIKQTSTNSAVTHWLPDVGGTLLNSGNYLNYKGHLRQNVMNQSSSTPTETPWFKIASMTLEGASSHAFGTFAIANGMSAGDVGILHVKVATGSTAGTNLSATARWISKTRIDPSTFVVTYTETANTSVKYELWCKLTNQWRTYITSIINEGARTQANIVWELSEDTTSGSATYGTPTGFSESAHTIDDGPMATTSNSANSEQTIFFNDSTVDGTLGYDSSLVFNPSTNTIYVTNPGGTRKSGYGGNGMSIRADSSTTWACGVNYYTSDGATQIGAIGAYGTANATEAGYLYMGKTYSDPWLKVAEDQITGYADMVISKATPKLTLNSGGSTPPTIELKRNGSSWRVMNESGAFVLKCDWDAENSTTTDWWQAFKISTTGAISGNGSGLTNLNASNITSGTLSSDRLPTVPITKGGTGGTTANAAAFNLIGDPVISETAIADTTKLAFYYATPSTSNGALYAKPASTVWTYIKTKADATYQPLKKKTVTLPATAGWYRIASSWEGINRCQGIFTIEATVSGRHTTATFTAQSSYGDANSTSITVLTASHYSNSAITKVRIVYHTTYSGNYAYLEVYNPAAAATKVTTNIDSSIGWELIDVVAGSIPSGYSNKEVTLSNNTMVATTFSGTASKVTSAMAAPTSTTDSTAYAIAIHSGNTAGSKSLLNNAGIRCGIKSGTTTVGGLAYLYLGNNKATGTAGNQCGGILMYSDTTAGGYITAPGLSERRDYALPNASGTIALTSDANKVLQTDLACTTKNNAGLRLPLLLGSKNTNPDNGFDDDPREITATTTTSGVNMTGLAWLETSYWTTGGDVGKAFARICASSFKVVGSGGSFEGTASKAMKLSYEPKINGVTFAGDSNISLGRVLYSGAGSSSVTLEENASNFDALLVSTALGTFILSTSSPFQQMAYGTTPGQSGGTSVGVGSVSFTINGTTLTVNTSKYYLSGTTSVTSSTSSTQTIIRVVGLHLI